MSDTNTDKVAELEAKVKTLERKLDYLLSALRRKEEEILLLRLELRKHRTKEE